MKLCVSGSRKLSWNYLFQVWDNYHETITVFFNLCEETISWTDEGQPRPKYIFNNGGTNIYFFTLRMFGPSPSPSVKWNYLFQVRDNYHEIERWRVSIEEGLTYRYKLLIFMGLRIFLNLYWLWMKSLYKNKWLLSF